MGLLSRFKFRAAAPAPAVATDPVAVVQALRVRARRRLIGAAMLLTVGLIGFPLLFESQPRPLPVDIAIDIPSREGAPPLRASSGHAVREEVLVPPPVEASPSEALMDTAEAASAPPIAAPPLAQVKPTKPAKPASAPSTAKTASAPAQSVVRAPATPAVPAVVAPVAAASSHSASGHVAVAPAPKPAPKAEPAAVPRPAPAEPKPVPSRTAEARTPPAPPVDAAADNGRYVVQIGAFSEATSAREARMKVEGLGLKTYTQVIESATGRRIRVRVGPYATKAEADKAAIQIKASGLPAAVLVL